MCGIVGIIHGEERMPVEADLLAHMRDTMAHRGPDGAGLYVDGNLGLGHRRLSIIDLSDAGHQPMSTRDGRFTITYNGEIYNYVELRRELEAMGYAFSSLTDTEVILNAFAAWGDACLNRFNGMFAFGIWDREERRLFCARDRWGIKPFYHATIGETLVFASEIKAIVAFLRTKNVEVAPDEQSLALHLWGLAFDRFEETFYKNVKRLMPGRSLEWKDGRLTVNRWYALEPGRGGSPNTFPEAAEAWRSLFTDSIRLRLRSDVPLGSCLSGGLDSSTIVCVMADLLGKSSGHRVSTFSACYENHSEIDERQYINAVVERTNAEGHETFPTVEELAGDLDKFLWHQDEPVGSTSQYAQYRVFRLARERGVTVMLDGQGADETITGYHGAFERYLVELLRRGKIGRASDLISSLSARYNYPVGSQWKKALLGLGASWLPQVSSYIKARDRKQGLWRILPTRTLPKDPIIKQWGAQSLLHAYLYRIATGSGLQTLLRYEDRNSMAFSIEARVPFLDYRLVEFAFNLPSEWILWGGQTKALLRAAMKNIVPAPILERQDKVGFSTPEHQWILKLATEVLPELVNRPLPVWEWIDRTQVRAVVDRVRRSGPAYSRNNGAQFWREINPLWRVLNVSLWSRQFA